MRDRSRLELFDQALTRLKAREPAKDILSSLPADVELAEMVYLAANLHTTTAVPSSTAQAASKQGMLQAARQTAKAGRGMGFGLWLRAPQFVLVLVVLIASLTISGLVSAQALPGQPLYGIKRSMETLQLAMTRDSSGKLQLEEVLDARRINEVIRLRSMGTESHVEFAGWLQQNEQGEWSVQGVPLITNERSPLWNVLLNGSYVQVTGNIQAEGVQVQSLELRLFTLDGQLQQVDNGSWQINGIPLEISEHTQLFTPLMNGTDVRASAIRLSNSEYLLLSLSMRNPAKSQTHQVEGIQKTISIRPTITAISGDNNKRVPVLELTIITTVGVDSTSDDGYEQDQDKFQETMVVEGKPDPIMQPADTNIPLEPPELEETEKGQKEERVTRTPEAED